SRKVNTSSLMTRPPRPVPVSADGSTPASAAAWRAAGDRTGSGCGFGGAVIELADGFGSARFASALGSGFGAGFVSAGAAAVSILPTTAPTATRSPSFAPMTRTPAAGAITSDAALSVSISRTGSFALTLAPLGLSQREMVPSLTDSPTDGTLISTAMGFFRELFRPPDSL